MHRYFTDEPVDEEALSRLAWAAGKAPMGGAELVRRILVVSDPAVVRTVRQVTPSFLANAPAVILVCTDVERAEISMGRQGRQILSLVDAGAAAENVALAAPALGVVAIFSFTFHWNDYLHPLIYLNSVQNYTIALGLPLLNSRYSSEIQQTMAQTVLAIIPVLLVFFFAQRHYIQGIVVSGVKG
jgi:hypothetical protein